MKPKTQTNVFAALALVTASLIAAEALPSWNDTAPKRALVAFVERVTKEGSPDFVRGPERIAVFDSDGTLWTELDFLDDKEGKPVAIQRHIGRRPVMAFGNSDGDLQMLQWTTAGPGPRFGLYVHHTDAGREWAYDRQSQAGRLDKGLDEARAKGWTVVSMKDDWRTIFPADR